jgi:hypothetical protein
VTDYLVVQAIRYPGELTDERLCKLMDALLDIAKADPRLADPDIAASMARGVADVQMTVAADGLIDAASQADCALRSALHAIGDATPGWRPVHGMRIDVAKEPSLLADA